MGIPKETYNIQQVEQMFMGVMITHWEILQVVTKENVTETKDYYIVEPVPTPPPTVPEVNTTPIHNYAQDVVLEEDVENGWEKLEIGEISDHGPFIDTHGPNLDTESRKLEDFFNNLFDDVIFTVIADATYAYAHKKIRSLLED